jgi:hypothetical protein
MKKESIEAPKFMKLLQKPEMKKLMQAGIGYEKMVVPVSIPCFA